jgi:hypothetical protein
MKEELQPMLEAGKSNTLYEEAVIYVAAMCTTLMDDNNFDPKTWESCFTPFIGPFVGDQTAKACQCVSSLPSMTPPSVNF